MKLAQSRLITHDVPRWMSRGVLLAVTVILALIGEKFLFDTAAQAAARGITFAQPIGLTIARVGLGGFPLACAVVTATCLASAFAWDCGS